MSVTRVLHRVQKWLYYIGKKVRILTPGDHGGLARIIYPFEIIGESIG